MDKAINYEILGLAFKVMSEKCYEAAKEQREGKPVTSCGMSDEDLERLCEIIPSMSNPMMTFGQVKKETHMSEATLRRAIANGELESDSCAGDKNKFFPKWKVLEFIRKRKKNP